MLSASRQTTKRSYRRMRYLLFLVAVLASAPAYAQSRETIVLPPGFAVTWQAPRPFKDIVPGNPNIVDVVPGATNRQLRIISKPLSDTNPGGDTNILLLDANGDQVANLLVTRFRYELARSP